MCSVDHWMEKAFELANEALDVGEVPIGCVFVFDNEIIATGRNTVNETRTAIDHAEMNCIDAAISWCKENKLDWKSVLSKTEVVVTVEPCIMCASALLHLNIPCVTYGCDNLRFGGCGSIVDTGLVMGKCFKITRGIQTRRAISLLKKFYEGTNPNAPLEKAMKKEGRKKRKLSLKEGNSMGKKKSL